MRVYVAKKMNENITSDLVTLKVRADGKGRWRYTMSSLQLTAKTAWFPIGISFTRGLFSGYMLVSGRVGQIFPSIFFMGKLAVSFFFGGEVLSKDQGDRESI